MITFGNIKKEHLESIKNWRNKQRDVLRQVKILTDEDQKKWWLKIQKDKTQKLFAILADKKFVGYCGLTNIDYNNKRAEISFLVDLGIAEDEKKYREYFLSVLDWLRQYGFNKMKLNKIFVETFEFRKNHVKILEKFGFKKEATLKKQYFKKGKFYDSIIHSIFS